MRRSVTLALLVLCLGALAVTLASQVHVARHDPDAKVRACASVALAANVGTAALIFSFTPFVTQIGVQFWFLAGALHGIERGLEPPEPISGDAYRASEAPPLPRSLAEAVGLFSGSALARECFGDAFVEQYTAMRRWEVAQFGRAVTDWERRRYFEQV